MKRLTLGLAGLAATAFLTLGGGAAEVVVTAAPGDVPTDVTVDVTAGADASNIIW